MGNKVTIELPEGWELDPDPQRQPAGMASIYTEVDLSDRWTIPVRKAAPPLEDWQELARKFGSREQVGYVWCIQPNVLHRRILRGKVPGCPYFEGWSLIVAEAD